MHTLSRGIVHASSRVLVLVGLELDLQRAFGKADLVLLVGSRQPFHQLLLRAERKHKTLDVAVLAGARLADRSARSGGVNRGWSPADQIANAPQRELPVLRMRTRVRLIVGLRIRITRLVPALTPAHRGVVAQRNAPGPVIRTG